MSRTYNVIDSDGHVLEPVDLWQRYIDPAYREQAPQYFIDDRGKEMMWFIGRASPALTVSGLPAQSTSPEAATIRSRT